MWQENLQHNGAGRLIIMRIANKTCIITNVHVNVSLFSLEPPDGVLYVVHILECTFVHLSTAMNMIFINK